MLDYTEKIEKRILCGVIYPVTEKWSFEITTENEAEAERIRQLLEDLMTDA